MPEPDSAMTSLPIPFIGRRLQAIAKALPGHCQIIAMSAIAGFRTAPIDSADRTDFRTRRSRP
jgi:hypothetical protein